jgi:hypothetical protein
VLRFVFFSYLLCLYLLVASSSAGKLPAPHFVASPFSVPLAFVPNRGQADVGIDYVTDLPGYKFKIRHDGFDLAVGSCLSASHPANRDGAMGGCASDASAQTISVRLRGANARVALSATDLLPGKHHFLAGPATSWRQDLPGYGQLRYRNVYLGIDLAYHAATGRSAALEYDFEMVPRADATRIRLHFDGGEVRIGADRRRAKDHSGALCRPRS